MSRPDRLKRQPSANTTPQSTPSFDPIDPDEEASQRTDDREEEVTEAVEGKEKADKNLVVAVILVLVRNSQMHQ